MSTAFSIARHNVTNAEFLEFVDAGGYSSRLVAATRRLGLASAGAHRHPLFWEHVEEPGTGAGCSTSFGCRCRGRCTSARLTPTRSRAGAVRACRPKRNFNARRTARLTVANAAIPGATHEPAASHGVFDFSSWDPEPAGSHPAGRSAWGVDDLVGNGWEWTSTPFAPFAGFRAMASYPEYSADFFDGEHFVIKGASPATARELLRPSFRNWFRSRYPYVYATFRLVKNP